MDPNQPKTPDQNVPIPEAPTNSYMDNVNEPQTPAFNNTDYWNNETENSNASTTSEPANPPEPMAHEEPQTTISEPEQTEPEPLSSPEPHSQPPTPPTSEPAQPTQEPDNSSYQKWDDPPASPSQGGPSTPTSFPSEPKSNTLTIIMIVVVIILLGATGLFAFQNYQLKKQPKPTPVASPSYEPTPSATPDPTAGWQTYSNSTYKFSFKYPANLENKGIAPQPFTGTKNLIQSFSDATTILPDTDAAFDGFSLYVVTNMNATTFDKYVDNEVLAMKKSEFLLNENLVKTPVSVNGISGYSLKFSGNKTFYYFPSPDTKTVIVISRMTAKENSTFLEVFDWILSTFSFTSASPSPSPATAGTCDKGYKAFAGDGYSLCYPETLVKTASSTSSQVVFENANETLKVMTNFQGGWGGSPCLFIDSTTVAGYKSKRLSWKTEQTGGGCDNTFTSFAEMINEGTFKFPFPYALELTSKKAPFQDNMEFLTIEKSFQVVSPSPSPNGS